MTNTNNEILVSIKPAFKSAHKLQYNDNYSYSYKCSMFINEQIQSSLIINCTSHSKVKSEDSSLTKFMYSVATFELQIIRKWLDDY